MDGDGDIDCPYDFDDKTGNRSNYSQSDKGDSPKEANSYKKEASHQKKNSTFDWGILVAVGIYIFFMFILPFLMS